MIERVLERFQAPAGSLVSQNMWANHIIESIRAFLRWHQKYFDDRTTEPVSAFFRNLILTTAEPEDCFLRKDRLGPHPAEQSEHKMGASVAADKHTDVCAKQFDLTLNTSAAHTRILRRPRGPHTTPKSFQYRFHDSMARTATLPTTSHAGRY